MTHGPVRFRPPRLAAWLVELFAPANQAESILGDLSEEFVDIALKRGSARARRWYWRQSLRTIGCLVGAAFRNASGRLAAVVLLGFLLSLFSADLPETVVVLLLRTQQPYSNRHVDPYMGFLNAGIPVVRALIALSIGCFVAVMARGKELAAALALAVLRTLPIAWLFLLRYMPAAPGQPTFDVPFRFFLIGAALDVIGTVVAGVLVREARSPSSPRLAVT